MTECPEIEQCSTTAVEDLRPETTRRPDVPGVPFILGDGRRWDLATPQPRIRPTFTIVDGKTTCECNTLIDYPRAISIEVKALLGEIEKRNDLLPLSFIIAPAVSLVVLCHDITLDQAASLFEGMSVKEVEELAVGMIWMFLGQRPASTTPEEPAKHNGESE